MTEITFLASLQAYQDTRIETIVARLKVDRPDVTIRILDSNDSALILAKYKLKFGPAILINDRLEFVGIPRYRMLVERIATSQLREPAPRSVMRSSKAGGSGE